MPKIPDDIREAARTLRNAVLWQSNASVEPIALALLAQREAAESRLAQLEAENGRLRKAATEAEETLRLVERPAFPDPVHHEEVKKIGRRIGFGALMSTASAAWREELAAGGYPVGGEFVAGPCQVTVVRALSIIRAALSTEREDGG